MEPIAEEMEIIAFGLSDVIIDNQGRSDASIAENLYLLHKSGVRLAVATSSKSAAAHDVIDALRLAHLVQSFACGDSTYSSVYMINGAKKRCSPKTAVRVVQVYSLSQHFDVPLSHICVIDSSKTMVNAVQSAGGRALHTPDMSETGALLGKLLQRRGRDVLRPSESFMCMARACKPVHPQLGMNNRTRPMLEALIDKSAVVVEHTLMYDRIWPYILDETRFGPGANALNKIVHANGAVPSVEETMRISFVAAERMAHIERREARRGSRFTLLQDEHWMENWWMHSGLPIPILRYALYVDNKDISAVLRRLSFRRFWYLVHAEHALGVRGPPLSGSGWSRADPGLYGPDLLRTTLIEVPKHRSRIALSNSMDEEPDTTSGSDVEAKANLIAIATGVAELSLKQ